MPKDSNPSGVGQVFLVGAPRSGTTLLQSRLALNSAVITFPETGFFNHLMPTLDRVHTQAYCQLLIETLSELKDNGMNDCVRRRLAEMHSVLSWLRYYPLQHFDLVPRKRAVVAYNNLRKALREDGELLPKEFPALTTMAEHASRFVEVLDKTTLSRGKQFWLEKSTQHVLSVDIIEKYLPQAKFIHIVRPQTEVAASLFDASQKYSQQGPWKNYRDLDFIIAKLNGTTEATRKCLTRPAHKIVRYVDLVADPATVLSDLCTFLGLEFEQAMLESGSSEVFYQGEVWKNEVCKPIRPPKEQFQSMFTEEQQTRLCARLHEL